MDELEGHKLEATLLEAADDVADEAALDAVGLQGRANGEHIERIARGGRCVP